ncbi:glycosyltransferase 61 family protein [Microbacterium indicum]|uniref:glycosyltransferase 61 family protein n=1 Tax=Microbacterium indicum TaxID=358100 RepID=UPI0004181535|nr:glycosyltransferase 61 family protein [Microbacterium indicum]
MSEQTPQGERLGVRRVDDALVVPTVRDPDDASILRGGVYGADGYVAGTAINRRSGDHGEPLPASRVPATARDGSVVEGVFGGPLTNHFGHFLLESLPRLWYAARHPELPVVWENSVDAPGGVELLGWQREILDIIGVRNAHVAVAEPTRFPILHVPDIGYRYDDWIHPQHAAFLAQYEGPAPEPGRRVWLSRGSLERGARDESSAVAERHLADAGWRIVVPEALTVAEQLDELSRAETIAGEEGSAFHLLLLMRSVAGRRFRVIRRRGPEHRNFRTIGDARGVDQEFFSLAGERIVEAEGRVVRKFSRNAVALLDALEVPVAARRHPIRGDKAAVALIRSTGVDRLLDIGARRLYAAQVSGVQTALVVSTRLEDDPRAVAKLAGRVDELPYALYVETFVTGDRPTYGMIRVDGGSAADIARDVAAAEPNATPDTVWVLPDTDDGRSVAFDLGERVGQRVQLIREGDDAAIAVAGADLGEPIERPAPAPWYRGIVSRLRRR